MMGFQHQCTYRSLREILMIWLIRLCSAQGAIFEICGVKDESGQVQGEGRGKRGQDYCGS